MDAQSQLAVAVEKERAATEELRSLKSQQASLESQNSLVRQEKARLLAQLDAEKSKREKAEDDSNRLENAVKVLTTSSHVVQASGSGRCDGGGFIGFSAFELRCEEWRETPTLLPSAPTRPGQSCVNSRLFVAQSHLLKRGRAQSQGQWRNG